jgi:NlpC/P60 family/Transglycosylase SLT domain
MITKIGIATLGVIITIPVLIAALAQAAFSALVGTGASQPSPDALADIPADYLTLYRTAATVCPGLDWNVLAGIGKVETNHGRLDAPGVHSGENTAGAGGPMQFLQPTFDGVTSRHPLPPGGASPPSRYDPHDAIYAAAYYLCDNGARRGDLHGAIFAYNHADWYVRKVLTQATRYAVAATVATGNCTTIQATNPTAWTAINYACAQRGLPYVWGGNGAELAELPNGQTKVTGGFDCSGLTRAAYAAAGIQIPRTAQTQYNAGPPVPPGQPILPGDLVFFGTSPNAVTHVGIAISNSDMINAPHQGAVVRIERIWRSNLLGATRPAATRTG